MADDLAEIRERIRFASSETKVFKEEAWAFIQEAVSVRRDLRHLPYPPAYNLWVRSRNPSLLTFGRERA
jgi:hypothetical protein